MIVLLYMCDFVFFGYKFIIKNILMWVNGKIMHRAITKKR